MRIYLAGPYSHENACVRERRYHELNDVALTLMKQGHTVFSPITHSHPLSLIDPMNAEFWLAQDEQFIQWADEIHVLCMPGWTESSGVARERNWAREARKCVLFRKPGTLDVHAIQNRNGKMWYNPRVTLDREPKPGTVEYAKLAR